MTSTFDCHLSVDFEGLLELEQLGSNEFQGLCHAGHPMRAYGGQVAAQALTAAGNTVPPENLAHSLHGYFLSAGNPTKPIVYEVERLRDGRSYRSRRVTARQDGEPIFALSASFKLPEDGEDRQMVMPEVPPPEDLPDPYEHWANERPDEYQASTTARVMSLRFVPQERVSDHRAVPGLSEQAVWLKPAQTLPDNQLLHVCALTYGSDITLASTASLDIQPHRSMLKGRSRAILTSLDHAVWIHRPFRADDWMLFSQNSPSSSDGRGLSTGNFWSRNGNLVATVVQESLLRRID
jgi:acyl-CoA thioesterase II